MLLCLDDDDGNDAAAANCDSVDVDSGDVDSDDGNIGDGNMDDRDGENGSDAGFTADDDDDYGCSNDDNLIVFAC